MTAPETSARRLERAFRKLHEATAARCRGDTVVLGGERRLAEAVRTRGLEAVEADPLGSGLPPDRLFHTAVVAGPLECAGEEEGERLLERAWSLIEPGGRLVVTVPNEGCAHCLEQVREFDRRKLAKLLKGYGKPRLATDQPFRWITMYVEKPRGRRARRNRTRIDRWRVTARLCRGRVIELGCNEGDLSGRIAERGLEVTGVDLSEEKIRRAREKHPEIPFLASDIRRLALSPGSFDTVVLAEVLEHVHAAEGDEMLAVAWNLLKPGGRLIVSVPNEDCIPHPHHVRRFDRRSLKRLLAPFGRPRLMLEQPYKWLLMVVRKAARAG